MVKKLLILYAKRDRGQYTKRAMEYYLPRVIFPEFRKMMFEE